MKLDLPEPPLKHQPEKGGLFRGIFKFLAGLGVLGLSLLILIFILIALPEIKVSKINQKQSKFSDEQWERIYEQAMSFYQTEFQGETLNLSRNEFPKDNELFQTMKKLGHEQANIHKEYMRFGYGGGHMQGRSFIYIFPGTKEDPWKGIKHSPIDDPDGGIWEFAKDSNPKERPDS